MHLYLMKGDARSAITACERVATLTNRRFGLGGLVSAYAAAGDHARAMVVLRELEARASREYVSPWQFAEAYLGLGDRDRTFAWLDSAYAAHDPFLLTTIVSPLWDPVRSDPRFARLRARLGLPPGEHPGRTTRIPTRPDGVACSRCSWPQDLRHDRR